ncbi:MAG: type II secretion system protein [Gammaproteobacteria bacterium]|nr:type II secretion system protein [Gammaproteobacteria bacterium]
MSLIKTLATGILTDKQRGSYSFNHASVSGFTLIELLTVVLIVSVIIGAGILSVSVGDRGRVQEAMRSTVSMMNAVADEAILSGRRYAVVWDKQSHFLRPLCRNEEKRNWECNKACFPDGCENIKVSLQAGWKLLFQDAEGSEFNALSEQIDEDEEQQSDYQDSDEDDAETKKERQWQPLVQFHPTGLWEPSGTMRVVYDEKQYLSLSWTATGRVRFGETKDY